MEDGMLEKVINGTNISIAAGVLLGVPLAYKTYCCLLRRAEKYVSKLYSLKYKENPVFKIMQELEEDYVEGEK